MSAITNDPEKCTHGCVECGSRTHYLAVMENTGFTLPYCKVHAAAEVKKWNVRHLTLGFPTTRMIYDDDNEAPIRLATPEEDARYTKPCSGETFGLPGRYIFLA